MSEISNILSDEEKNQVDINIRNGYSSTVGMLAHSEAGTRSGLGCLWITQDVYNSIKSKGYFDISEYKFGTEILYPNPNNFMDPTNINGVKFSYLTVFAKSKISKISDFLIQKVQ